MAVLEILEVWSDESGWWGRGSTEWEEEDEEEGDDEEDGEDDEDLDDVGDDGEELHARSYGLLSIRGPSGEAWPLPRLGLFPDELGGRPRLGSQF